MILRFSFICVQRSGFELGRTNFLQGLAVLAELNPKPIEVRTNLSLDSSEFWVRPLQ